MENIESMSENNEEVNEVTNTNININIGNAKYKPIISNNNLMYEQKTENNLLNLEKFLENEKNNNQNEAWCKLNKTNKTKKLLEYAEIYKTENSLSDEEKEELILFFKDCLERNKLKRVKDVLYDNTSGVVKEIPGLFFIKEKKHFTLKNIEKRVSTLKSLAVKKTNNNNTIKHTIKNKISLNEDNA